MRRRTRMRRLRILRAGRGRNMVHRPDGKTGDHKKSDCYPRAHAPFSCAHLRSARAAAISALYPAFLPPLFHLNWDNRVMALPPMVPNAARMLRARIFRRTKNTLLLVL